MRNALTRRVTAAMFALAFVTASATTASAAPGLNQNVENEAAASAADNSKTSSTTTLSSGESMSISEEDWSELSTDADEAPSAVATQQATPAPACVNAVVETGFIQVHNNCGFDVRVKVVRAYAPDTECSLVVNGTRHNIGPNLGRIDRVELC